MKKLLHFSKRHGSDERSSTVNHGLWANSERSGGKALKRISATSLNPKAIQVVRGAYNIDLNKVDTSFTKLHRACLLNDIAQVKKHVQKSAVNLRDSSHRYPLHLATVNGNFAIVKLLMDNGANPNVQDIEGSTPLLKAIECGHHHLVKYLLMNGADPNMCDIDKNSALHWALITDNTDTLALLVNSNKCNYSIRNARDETCLHLAVRNHSIVSSIYETMIKNGADALSKDQLGLTALDIAQACENQAVLKVFENFVQGNLIYLDDKQPNIPNISEDYKQKYIEKNRENLEFEKKLIHLHSQIERLTIDLTYLREENDKLGGNVNQLSSENVALKSEVNQLLAQLDELKGRTNLNDTEPQEFGPGMDNFLMTKSLLQERINKLKLEMTG